MIFTYGSDVLFSYPVGNNDKTHDQKASVVVFAT